MNQFFMQLGYLAKPHMGDFSMMIIATLLVIYGNSINQAIRRQVSGMHFILRTFVFILICAFGYGLATVHLAPLLSRLLLQIPTIWLGLACLAILIALGMLAERKKQI